MDSTRNSFLTTDAQARDLQPLIPMTMESNATSDSRSRNETGGSRSHAGNVVRSNANSLVSNRTLNSKPVLAFLAGFRIMQIVIACWALLQGEDASECSDLSYLRLWLLGYTLRCMALLYILWNRYKLVQLSTNVGARERRVRVRRSPGSLSSPGDSRTQRISRREQARTEEENESLQLRIERLSFFLDVFYAVWFVLGNIWLHTVEPCINENQILYTVCALYLILGFIGFIMPLVMCIAICCCLPCAIVAITVLGNRLQENLGAPQEIIEELEEYQYQDGKLGGKGIPQGEATCSICLDDFQNGDKVRQLPCQHFFHSSCVDKWLALNHTCPLCRESIMEEEEEHADGCGSDEADHLPV